MLKRNLLRWEARLALAGLAAFTSTNYLVMKVAVAELSPFSLIFWRFALASLVLLSFQRKIGFPLQGNFWRDGMPVGAFLAFAMIFLAFTTRAAHSGEAAFFVNSDAAFVPIFAWLFLRERPSRPSVTGVCLALPGLALLSIHDGFQFRAGSLLGIASATMFALWLISLTRVTKRHHPFSLSLAQMTSAVVITGALSLLLGQLEFPKSAVAWLSCIYLGVVGTGLRFAVQGYLQRFVESTETALIYLVEPVCAAIIGAVLLHEQLSGMQLAGCALILFGIAIPQLQNALRKEKPKQPDQTVSAQQIS